MQKTTKQLQANFDSEKAYTTKLNRQIDRLREQLRSTISLSEHQRGVGRKQKLGYLSPVEYRLKCQAA